VFGGDEDGGSVGECDVAEAEAGGILLSSEHRSYVAGPFQPPTCHGTRVVRFVLR
jgi:hypothetical protein